MSETKVLPKHIQDEVDRQLALIRRGTAEIVPEEDLVKKLKDAIVNRRPLRVKLGLDPTAPDIHLGHTVVLRKLRDFQDLGHQVVIVIGDFTGRVGDPSGKSETRKQLTEEEVNRNAATYKEQIFKVLDPAKTEMTFNSHWLQPLNFADILQLAAKYTVARMLERDDFSKRMRENLPIGVHELFYPLMQGYDSVALRADVELGGTDQKFNLLVGRVLQKEYGQEPQVALMMPILEGLDGVNKMSKSLGNYIGVNESPREIYGKTMSIADALMVRYFELVTRVSAEEIQSIAEGLKSGALHPRDAKMRLAREIVALFHGNEAAQAAQDEFINIFQKRELPDEIPDFIVPAEHIQDGKVGLVKALVLSGLAASNGEARRKITEGAVKVDNETIKDFNTMIPVEGTLLRLGKRKFVRLLLA
ncbi:tyrosyl-tRNA synthetase [Heliomicrobium modesticaldum Ice1]|uniref:Tyrosine--tRNA ligase n=1 Tax=Heliobacterium modesticaldum (strain ATCC 51547 / Ice1) TaxID=498761 RepID=B0TF60_HELMI|nr:tyrosine--tRNA ligase [Heliomicrobium modesticaldum]ABZ84377.1 tyrosyl-tRNA synthetase [Heliomicrobium modesticaldum Ice1]